MKHWGAYFYEPQPYASRTHWRAQDYNIYSRHYTIALLYISFSEIVPLSFMQMYFHNKNFPFLDYAIPDRDNISQECLSIASAPHNSEYTYNQSSYSPY